MRKTDETGAPRRERSIDAVRTEALSDGIFAIAATLLVLNLDVPDLPQGQAVRELPRALVALAPSLLSYVLSFLVIAAFWTAHRALFRHVRDVDRRLGWLNVLFLMVIAFLPFSTGLFDRYAQEPLAVAIYVGTLAMARLTLTAVWWYASADQNRLRETTNPAHVRFHRLRGLLVSLAFVLSVGLAYVSVTAAAIAWVAIFAADQALLHAYEQPR